MSTTTRTTVSSPTHPRISIGNRTRLAIAGGAISAVLAAGIALAIDDDGGASFTPAAAEQSLARPAGAQAVDPRPDIDPRQATERFHHRSQPVSSAAVAVDPRPDVDQRHVKERFNHR